MLHGFSSTEAPWPVMVIGAGAAGLMAAISAARAGARVAVLETRRAPGAKIRASGGGRCNVLPSRMALEDFDTGGSPNTLRNMLFSWPHADVVRFFTVDLGLPLKTEDTGKMFPVSDDARDVVDALVNAASAAGVAFVYDAKVVAMSRVSHVWHLETSRGVFAADNVIMAAGGLSLPKSGSDGGGWAMAQRLGHRVSPTYPALVPLCSGDARWHALSGLSAHVRLLAMRNGRVVAQETGPMLLTHKGLSGPTVLNISRWFTAPGSEGTTLHVNWGDVAWEEQLLQAARSTPSQAVGTVLRQSLPKRLVETLGDIYDLPLETRLSELTKKARKQAVDALGAGRISISGSEGYRTAEVTGGGVPLAELHVKSLESRIHPNLFLAGEMLDVVGRLGGYNFMWAWVTGRRAGLGAAAKSVRCAA